ncbi:MAG: CRISPR-associated endoribonuclease Cas6 [bacterium]
MRITVSLASEKQVVLPFEHNQILQGMIYHHLPPESATRLHQEGFLHHNRKFKLFTFSRILTSPLVDTCSRQFIFSKNIKFVIASPIGWFMQDLAEHLIRQDFVMLGRNKLRPESIHIHVPRELPEKMKITMLSPITVYSTMQKGDGRKKTYYFSPFEPEFSEQIEANIQKKFEILNLEKCNYSLTITPLFSGNRNERILIYKDFVIKAWDGLYELEGRAELLDVAYNTGLGAKNSQGFGCFEVAADQESSHQETGEE